MSQPIAEFRQSQPLTLGVELELQLVSVRDFDLTRGATDLLGSMDYDGRFGEIKLEITESMIEVSTLPRTLVDGIAADLVGLRKRLSVSAYATISPSAAAARIPSTAGRSGGFVRVIASMRSPSVMATWPSNSRSLASTFMSAVRRVTKRSG
jgi:hypothetical protein